MQMNGIDLINELYSNRKYLECRQACFELLKNIDVNDKYNERKVFICYYKISCIYQRFGRYETAIKYAKKAKIHCGFISEDTGLLYDRLHLNWTFSFCYYKVNIDKSTKFIEYVIKDALKIMQKDIDETEKNAAEVAYNEAHVHKALMLNDEQMLLDALEVLDKYEYDNGRWDEILEDKFIFYYRRNNKKKAIEVAYQINNDTLRMMLLDKVKALAV